MNQRWRIASFLNDSGLAGRIAFNIAFQPSPKEGGLERVWIASSDGLREYDGIAWRRYGKAQGLPSDFVRAVHLSAKGELWVATDLGAGVYDGSSFRTMGSETGLAGLNVRRIAEDRDGTLWFCSDSWPDSTRRGGISSYREGRWRAYRAADGLPSEYVVNYFQDSRGRHFAATLQGVVELRGERWTSVFPASALKRGSLANACFAEIPGEGLMVSTGYEFFRLRDGEWEPLAALNEHRHGIVAVGTNAVVCARVEPFRGVFKQLGTNGWTELSSRFPLRRGYVEDIRMAPDGSVWAVGFETVIRWDRGGGQWREFTGNFHPEFEDPGGRIWFTRRARTENWELEPVRFQDGRWERFQETYLGLAMAAGGHVWGWTFNALVLWKGAEELKFPASATGLRSIHKGVVDGRGRFWVVGLGEEGRFKAVVREAEQWKPAASEGTERLREILMVTSAPSGCWVAAEVGEAGSLSLVHLDDNPAPSIELPRRLVSEYGRGLHADGHGKALWVFGQAGLHRWDLAAKGWTTIQDLPARAITAVADRGEELWVTYNGALGGTSGISRLRDGLWTSFPLEDRGSLSRSSDNTLLAGAVGMFHVIPNGAGARPIAIETPNREPIMACIKDSAGRYWACSAGSMSQFTPDQAPPRSTLDAAGTNILQGASLHAKATAIERNTPIEARTDHRFSWKLDDGNWSDFDSSPEHRVPTAGLSPGDHTLWVRSQDSGMSIEASPAGLHFRVHPVPLQSRVWFLPTVITTCLLLAALALAAMKARRQLSIHAATLEERVRERTLALEADIEQRRKLSLALQASETKFATAFHHSPVAKSIQRLSDGRILEVNASFEKLSGYGRAELIGHTEAELGLEPMDAGGMATEFDESRTRLVTLRTRSGENRHILESSVMVSLLGETCALKSSVDMTDRRRQEESVRASEERFRTVVESMGEGLLITDLDDVIIHANSRMTSLTGYSLEEMRGRPAYQLLTPPGEWEDVRSRNRRRSHGEAERYEVQLLRKDGTLWWAVVIGSPLRNAQGEVVGTVGALSDVTAQREAQSALAAEQQRLAAIVGSAMDAIITVDEAQRILVFNPAAERMFGHSATAVLGSPLQNLVPECTVDAIRAVLSDPQGDGPPQSLRGKSMKVRGKRSTGDTFPIEASLSRVEVGGVWLYTLTCRDLTDRERAESLRDSLETQLRQAQKMEALGTLAGGIAHDFNNILGAILGNVELGKMEVEPDHPAAVCLGEIGRAGQRAKALVKQILAFSNRESIQRQNIPLEPVVAEVISLLRATIPAGIEIIQRIGGGVPRVFADSNQIHQILINLGTNAWQAMPGVTGRIEIALDPVELDAARAARHPDLKPGSYACLTVSDNGQGMNAATLERIFEPFFTTKAPGKGTGLGLAVVHGIVRRHHGAIHVESEPGKGTVFRIFLPAVSSSVGAPIVPSPKPVRDRSQRALMVDSAETSLRAAPPMMERLGWTVLGFTDPEEALEAFRRDPDGFSVAILDADRPGEHNLTTATRLRAIRAGLPIILNSGQITDALRDQARALGIQDFLTKPNTLEDLSRILHRLTESHS